MHLQRSLLNYKRIYSSECNNVNMQLTLEVEAMITKNLFEDAFFKLALSKIRLWTRSCFMDTYCFELFILFGMLLM